MPPPRPPNRKPNVRDVARYAGVSVATVSRVLNRPAQVAEATRARVDQAIDTLQFVPSSAARAINSGRTRLIGALIPTLDHAIFSRFVDAVEEELGARNLSLIIANTGHDTARELDKAKRLMDIGVEGLLVSGITRSPGFRELVARHQVPVIATSYFETGYTYPTIGYDNAEAANTALDHLLGLGHADIAVLTGPISNNDRTRARLRALEAANKTRLRFCRSGLSFPAAARTVRQIRQDHPTVTALLCLSDVLAQGALLQLKSDGLRVPDEMSVIGIDDLPSSASYDPPLTTVHLPVKAMGTLAARAISDWIESQNPAPSTALTTKLILRDSTGPCPAAAPSSD